MKKSETRGYLYILIGTTLWGISSVVEKILLITVISPAELVLIRLTLSVFFLFFIFILFDRNRLIIIKKDLPYFIALGSVGIAGSQLTFYFTIIKIQVGPAILIQYLSLIWVVLYALLFQKEPFSKLKIFSLLLALFGSFLVIGGYRIDLLRLNKIGITTGIISSFFAAFTALYGEKVLRRYDPWTTIFYGFGFGALFYWIFISPVKVITDGHALKVWMAFFYIAIFATLIPCGLYFKGIERIRATRGNITATWEPVVASFTAYFVLGEVLHLFQVLGGIAVITAVVLLQIAKEKTAPSSSLEIRHKG
jgi:drug/metabolite transporter (DMT)-like permease